jgi:enoyl-CoA hydratase
VSEGRLHYEVADGVARVTFDNQKAYNALTMEMWRGLGELCGRIAQDRSVRVVVFRGAGGKAFISGTDIGGFLDFETGQQGVEYERLMDRYVGAVEALPQPARWCSTRRRSSG